jgi:hypothetical protein
VDVLPQPIQQWEVLAVPHPARHVFLPVLAKPVFAIRTQQRGGDLVLGLGRHVPSHGNGTRIGKALVPDAAVRPSGIEMALHEWLHAKAEEQVPVSKVLSFTPIVATPCQW